MTAPRPSCSGNPRLVGDPVDVVTGVQTDSAVDFMLPGPLPFGWNRHYSSARHLEALPLGFGHTHEFDHTLTLDVDGLAYRGPTGEVVGFPDLAIHQSEARIGFVLRRATELDYRLDLPSGKQLEFSFTSEKTTTPLKRLARGDHAITFAYSQNGQLVEIVDALKRSFLVIPDSIGRIISVSQIDSPGTSTGTMIKKKALVTYDYDAAGNLIRAKDVFGFTQSFQYDARHLLTRRTDRRGYSFFFTYDERGRCVHSKGEDGLFEVRLEYDPQVKATFVRKGGNPAFVYFHSDANALTKIVDPYGGATSFNLDDQGRTVEEIDPLGNVTRLNYDSQGRHNYRIDPAGQILPTKDEDPDPPDPRWYQIPETPLEWEFGRLVDAQDIQPPRADDRVLAQFPASIVNTTLGKTTTYDKNAGQSQPTPIAAKQLIADEFGRPLEQPSPRYPERWKYDPNGNLIEHHDRDGAVAKSVFGSWNSIRQTIDPLGNVTAYEHSQAGTVVRVVDPGGTAVEYGYDFNDRIVEVRTQGQILDRYSRDAAGNVVAKQNGLGRTLVKWAIGPGNLINARTLSTGESHEFEHDAKGRVISMKAPTGTATFSYGDQGELIGDERDGLGVVHRYEFGKLMETTYLGKFKVGFRADDNGDLIVADPAGGQHRFQFGTTGLIAKDLANGTRELSQFDDRGRCLRKSLYRPVATSAPQIRSYLYSAHGDLLGVNDTVKGQTKYAYDAGHRLTEEAIPGSPPRRFAFDAAGNLLVQPGLSVAVVGPGNTLNEANGATLTFNDRGHLSARSSPRGSVRYEYDDLDMLVKCDLSGSTWTANYDAYCRRVSKTWQGRTTTYYWDDLRPAAEVRHDGSVRLYIYADPAALVPFLFVEYDSLDAAPESGRRYAIFTNQVGVPIRVEGDDGKPCWSARIDPYGLAEIAKDNTIEMPLRFPGHYFDPETGLHSNRFRYYSPELGRYLQPDPAGQEAAINLYAYPVNPLIDADIDGLKRGGGGPKPGRPSRSTPSGANPQCPRTQGTQGKKLVDQMIKDGHIVIDGDKKYQDAVKKDLYKVANSKTGRESLGAIRDSGKPTTIKNWDPKDPKAGNACGPTHGGAYPPGNYTDKHGNPVVGTGKGSPSTVIYNPDPNQPGRGPQSPPDTGLNHELGHAANNANGKNDKFTPAQDPSKYPNREEEKNTTQVDNGYRKEKGLEERPDYWAPLP